MVKMSTTGSLNIRNQFSALRFNERIQSCTQNVNVLRSMIEDLATHIRKDDLMKTEGRLRSRKSLRLLLMDHTTLKARSNEICEEKQSHDSPSGALTFSVLSAAKPPFIFGLCELLPSSRDIHILKIDAASCHASQFHYDEIDRRTSTLAHARPLGQKAVALIGQ